MSTERCPDVSVCFQCPARQLDVYKGPICDESKLSTFTYLGAERRRPQHCPKSKSGEHIIYGESPEITLRKLLGR